jgi:hypothetical protein
MAICCTLYRHYGDIGEEHGVADGVHDVLDVKEDGWAGVQRRRQQGGEGGRTAAPTPASRLQVSITRSVILVTGN